MGEVKWKWKWKWKWRVVRNRFGAGLEAEKAEAGRG